MIVIPMAGLSSRFFKAGYDLPKYMLDMHGGSVFAHALGSFSAYFATTPFLIICRDLYDTPEFVRRECAAMGLPGDQLKLVVLDAETSGQAESVALGLRRGEAPRDAPLTIFNIDTFRPGFRFPEAFDVAGVDGYLEVFHGEGEHWSFVRPDAAQPAAMRAAEVTEKVRISDLCSDGLYHFRSVGSFFDLYAEIEARDPATLQGGERYVAPLYNIAIGRGADIRYTVVEPRQIRFCGTPEEYQALLALSPFGPDDPTP